MSDVDARTAFSSTFSSDSAFQNIGSVTSVKSRLVATGNFHDGSPTAAPDAKTCVESSWA